VTITYAGDIARFPFLITGA